MVGRPTTATTATSTTGTRRTAAAATTRHGPAMVTTVPFGWGPSPAHSLLFRAWGPHAAASYSAPVMETATAADVCGEQTPVKSIDTSPAREIPISSPALTPFRSASAMPGLRVVGQFLAQAPMLLHGGRSVASPPPLSQDWWIECAEIELAGPFCLLDRGTGHANSEQRYRAPRCELLLRTYTSAGRRRRLHVPAGLTVAICGVGGGHHAHDSSWDCAGKQTVHPSPNPGNPGTSQDT
jgi:hypothetical protein